MSDTLIPNCFFLASRDFIWIIIYMPYYYVTFALILLTYMLLVCLQVFRAGTSPLLLFIEISWH